MCLFVGILVIGFVSVSKALRLREKAPVQQQFVIWALGCSLFAQTGTMMSVSYFDQSVFFLYLLLAAIGSLQTAPAVEEVLGIETSVHVPANSESDLAHYS